MEGPKDFRGYSGLWVSKDGLRVDAVEGGDWMTGVLTYRAGDLVGFRLTATGPLHDETGKPFKAEDDKDAEALDFDGRRFLVGFETRDRVLAYRRLDGVAETIPLPPEALFNIPRGAGFSSVAALSRKSLIALPEFTRPDPKAKPGDPAGTRAWLITPKTSGPVWLRADPLWVPVSLSALPDGDLLLLELGYDVKKPGPITETRLSRIKAKDIAVGNVMIPQTLTVLRPPLAGTRFEGSSVRTGPKGEILVYLVSNDPPVTLYMFELVE